MLPLVQGDFPCSHAPDSWRSCWPRSSAVAFAGAADAGWVTFKHDTNQTIVVQEVVTINGKQVRGKPTKVLAGGAFREFQNAPGVKSYEEILDGGNPPGTDLGPGT